MNLEGINEAVERFFMERDGLVELSNGFDQQDEETRWWNENSPHLWVRTGERAWSVIDEWVRARDRRTCDWWWPPREPRRSGFWLTVGEAERAYSDYFYDL